MAFGSSAQEAPDRVSCFNAFRELRELPNAAHRDWRLVLVDVTQEEVEQQKEHILSLLNPCDTVMDLSISTALWFAVRGAGRMWSPEMCETGGSVDSPHVSMLASASYRVAAVGQPRANVDIATTASQALPASPDKSEAFSPLVSVLIAEHGKDVLLAKLGKEYRPIIHDACESLGIKKVREYVEAAAREGLVRVVSSQQGLAVRLARECDIAHAQQVEATLREQATIGTPYCRMARVIVVGTGADETLGGYSRHQKAFARRGPNGLQEELDRDFSRLWQRNLGRDDRVISDHGVLRVATRSWTKKCLPFFPTCHWIVSVRSNCRSAWVTNAFSAPPLE